MQKVFLYSLLVSLLVASAFAAPSNYKFRRFIQEAEPVISTSEEPVITTSEEPVIATSEDPVIITPLPETTEDSTLPTPADNSTIIIDNSTLPTQPVDNSTIIIDNTTAPVDNSTLPVDNSTIIVDNSTLPVDNSTLPIDNSTLPIDNSTLPIIPDNSTQSEQNITTFQDTNATQFLKVIGRSSGKVKSGQVMIGFTVETIDSQASYALQNNSQIVNSTMEQFKSLGLNETDISVSGIQVLPLRSSSISMVLVNETSSDSEEPQFVESEPEETIEFQVRNSFVVSTNQTELVGQILDLAMQNGVNYIDYVNYTSSDDDIATLREQLLEDALDHAERLARKIIEKLGYEMGPAMSVRIIDDEQDQTVLLGDQQQSQSLLNNSQSMYQQLVEVQYAMRSSQSSSQ